MSTSLAIAFPWGRYHATPWGRNVNEGAVEWPPSPWRVLRALYATWRARAPHLPDDLVHALLGELLGGLPEYVLPPYVEAHTRHYLPDIEYLTNVPGGRSTDKALDTFVVFERGGEVVVTWPVALDEKQSEALAELAGLLPYLGRAESICEARLLDESENPASGFRSRPLERAMGSGDGTSVELLVPDRPFDLAALTARTTEVRARGFVDPPRTHRQLYERPEPAAPVRSPRRRRRGPPTAVRWAITAPARPSVRAAVAVADILRQASMSVFGRCFDGATSPVLAGKHADGAPRSGHEHAHYLAIDADGDRLLDHLVAWAPAGFGERELAALDRLQQHGLVGFGHVSDFRPVRLGVEAVGPIENVAPELCGPARVWESHTPFAPPRHAKRRTTWGEHVATEVRRELRSRGIREPATEEILRGDWLSYRRYRPTKHRLQDARRAVGVRMTFEEPVVGPLALGALSHFGLGLFVPVDSR